MVDTAPVTPSTTDDDEELRRWFEANIGRDPETMTEGERIAYRYLQQQQERRDEAGDR